MTKKGWNEFNMSIHAFSNMPKFLFYDKESNCLNHLEEYHAGRDKGDTIISDCTW